MAAPAVASAASSAAGAGASSGVGAAVGGAVSGGMTLFSSLMNNLFNKKNIERQNEYNERLMREAWARDDTAYQRMVRDLEAAGLSKWLATGNSPMSSSPISVDAPKYDFGGFADAAKHSIQGYTQLMQTKIAQETHEHEMDMYTAQTNKAEAEAREANARANIAEHDERVFTSRDEVASTDSYGMRWIAEAIKTLKGENRNFNVVVSGLTDFFKKSPKKEVLEVEKRMKDGEDVSLSEFRDAVNKALGFDTSDIFSDSEIEDMKQEVHKHYWHDNEVDGKSYPRGSPEYYYSEKFALPNGN